MSSVNVTRTRAVDDSVWNSPWVKAASAIPVVGDSIQPGCSVDGPSYKELVETVINSVNKNNEWQSNREKVEKDLPKARLSQQYDLISVARELFTAVANVAMAVYCLMFSAPLVWPIVGGIVAGYYIARACYDGYQAYTRGQGISALENSCFDFSKIFPHDQKSTKKIRGLVKD